MEKKKGISGSTLKMIAIVTMLIDHIGAAVLARLLMVNGLGELDQTNADAIMQWLSANGALYWTYTIMRMIGRVAFPIFCFLLVEGFLHTHDVKKYAMRLGLFALLSEIPFDLAFSSKILEFNYQNVFFTLFIGLLTMIAYRAVEEKEEWNQALKVILYILIVAAGMALAYFLKTDYAEKGVFCIMVLYSPNDQTTITNGERGLKRKISSLRSFYTYYYKRQAIETNPVQLVDMPKIHDKAIIRLDAGETAALLDYIEHCGDQLTGQRKAYYEKTKLRDLAIVTLLLGTGIRVSECVGLDVEDIDFRNNGSLLIRK